jgi:hypothetical protein
MSALTTAAERLTVPGAVLSRTDLQALGFPRNHLITEA